MADFFRACVIVEDFEHCVKRHPRARHADHAMFVGLKGKRLDFGDRHHLSHASYPLQTVQPCCQASFAVAECSR